MLIQVILSTSTGARLSEMLPHHNVGNNKSPALLQQFAERKRILNSCVNVSLPVILDIARRAK